jgi:hypothetical protein
MDLANLGLRVGLAGESNKDSTMIEKFNKNPSAVLAIGLAKPKVQP